MLLPAKSLDVYQRILQVLVGEVSATPDSIGIDFEQAMLSAIRAKLPNEVVVEGCNFHWKSAIFKNVGTKGCLSLFHENEQFQIGLDLIYQLCMVPAADVVLAWETVILGFFEEHFPDNETVDGFLLYIERTYDGKMNQRTNSRRQPMFPHEMFSIYDRVVQERGTTNNGLESWNARWNNSMGTNHNIWRVISGFKNEDALAKSKHQEMLAGRCVEQNPSRKDRQSARMRMLKSAMDGYNRDNIKEYMYGLREDV